MASADFTKLTGKKLQNIEKYKNQGNIKNIADIKTSDIRELCFELFGRT